MPRMISLLVVALLATACALRPEAPSGVVDESSQRKLSLGVVVGSAGRFGDQVWRGVSIVAS